MKPPTGLRARNIAAFQAERSRIRSVVEQVWKRDDWKCVVCHQPVTRMGVTPKQTGKVKFTNPHHPSFESGRLLCGEHFHGRRNILAPKFVLVK